VKPNRTGTYAVQCAGLSNSTSVMRFADAVTLARRRAKRAQMGLWIEYWRRNKGPRRRNRKHWPLPTLWWVEPDGTVEYMPRILMALPKS
jgi:hypothetical protein